MLRRRVGQRVGRAMLASALALGTALAPAAAVHARDGAGLDNRPWGRRTLLPSFGFGLGFSRDATSLGFGLGFRYFAIAGLGLGLSLSDSVLIFSESIKSNYPGINKQVPTNTFYLTPSAQYVFFRSRWFSPYVHAGVGPAFFNNRRGVIGHWVAGPGAYINVGGPVYLTVGVDFSGMFPVGKCNDAYLYRGSAANVQLSGFCSFNWSPNLGLVVAFGGGKRRRNPPPTSAPRNPLPDAIEQTPPPSSAPTPIEPVSPQPQPEPTPPSPLAPQPEGPTPAPAAAPAQPTPEGPAPTPTVAPSPEAPPPA